ncbi:MAG: undecaprenyl diphosphate synthase family protein, partial [Oscillospiraceae bacterium]|nr:undecaprenyl diphosphate synthase family protein [Candidatus Equicaccousia limihippi]
VRSGEISPDDITEDTVSKNLYAPDVPDPELIIRPSGEYRLSNFLIWQGAYSEFWYSDILWPDFKPSDLDKAIKDFNNRNRRFGGV